MPGAAILTWLLVAGSAAVAVAFWLFKSVLVKSQKRGDRRSETEARDAPCMPALNAFGYRVSAEDALEIRALRAELSALRAHERELEDDLHRRRQELARLRSNNQALEEQIANYAPLRGPKAFMASLDLAAAAA